MAVRDRPDAWRRRSHFAQLSGPEERIEVAEERGTSGTWRWPRSRSDDVLEVAEERGASVSGPSFKLFECQRGEAGSS